MTTKREKIRFIKAAGWHTYYHENYWVNPAIIDDPKSQDYTNYGMNLDDAFRWQSEGRPRIKQRFGIPFLNIAATLDEPESLP